MMVLVVNLGPPLLAVSLVPPSGVPLDQEELELAALLGAWLAVWSARLVLARVSDQRSPIEVVANYRSRSHARQKHGNALTATPSCRMSL